MINKYLGVIYQHDEQLATAIYWFRRQFEEIGFICPDIEYVDLVSSIQRETKKDFNESVTAANNIVTLEITKHKALLAGNGPLYTPNFKYRK